MGVGVGGSGVFGMGLGADPLTTPTASHNTGWWWWGGGGGLTTPTHCLQRFTSRVHGTRVGGGEGRGLGPGRGGGWQGLRPDA